MYYVMRCKNNRIKLKMIVYIVNVPMLVSKCKITDENLSEYQT